MDFKSAEELLMLCEKSLFHIRSYETEGDGTR